MTHEDETPKAVYPEGYRSPSVADGTVSPGLVDAVLELFDRYGPAGVESTVTEIRQMAIAAAEIAALTIVLGDAPANTELVTTAGAEALARYLYARGVQVEAVVSPDRRPVTATARVVESTPGHVTVRVWVGRQPGSRGNAGSLTFRADEWAELSGSGLLSIGVEQGVPS